MTDFDSVSLLHLPVLDGSSLSICDTTGFGSYQGGGIAIQVKQTEKMKFVSHYSLSDFPFIVCSLSSSLFTVVDI